MCHSATLNFTWFGATSRLCRVKCWFSASWAKTLLAVCCWAVILLVKSVNASFSTNIETEMNHSTAECKGISFYSRFIHNPRHIWYCHSHCSRKVDVGVSGGLSYDRIQVLFPSSSLVKDRLNKKSSWLKHSIINIHLSQTMSAYVVGSENFFDPRLHP